MGSQGNQGKPPDTHVATKVFMSDGLEKSGTQLSTTHIACFGAFSARVINSIGESLSKWSDLQAGNAGEHFRRSYASKTATRLMPNLLFAIRPNNCDDFSMQFSTASLFQLLHEIQAPLVRRRGACMKGSPSGDVKHAFSTSRWKSTEAGLLKRGLLHGLAGTYCTPQRHVVVTVCTSTLLRVHLWQHFVGVIKLAMIDLQATHYDERTYPVLTLDLGLALAVYS